ncbi:MAG: hypothetical protein WA962_05415 [Ornithinimicrobium sp.]
MPHTGLDEMATPESVEPPRTDSVFTVMLRGSLPPSALAGALTAAILGVLDGGSALVAGLLGTGIALAFFGSALLGMSRFVKNADPMLFMAVGMTLYFAQVLVLLGVLIVARGIESLDMRSAGIAMLVTVVVWQVAQMRAWRRARVPVYDEAHTQERA